MTPCSRRCIRCRSEDVHVEAIFRPDGGSIEQRWFHLQKQGPRTGCCSRSAWLATGPGQLQSKHDRQRDAYEQQESASARRVVSRGRGVRRQGFSNYVDGVRREGGGRLSPQGAGRSSMGVRINLVYYFKGAIHSARFTRRALVPAEFLKVPSGPVPQSSG
jgi:hypothetical protein